MKKIFILTLLTVLSVPVFAHAEYTVYTWGYQDIMVSMLEAVKYFMGTKSFGDMFKVAMLLSMLTIFLSLLNDRGFSPVVIFQKVILIIALQTFLVSTAAQMTLNVVDVSGNGSLSPNGTVQQVEEVPGIVGYPLYLLSNLEHAARNAFRNSLNWGGLRTGAQYLDGMSVITALNLYQSTTNVRINNPDFTKSYQSFVENCVLPDMVSGYLDVRAVTQSGDLWQLFGQDLHHARIGSFYMDHTQEWGPDGQILTCDKLYAAIDAQFATVSSEAENQLKAGLGLAAGIRLDQIIGSVNTAIVGFQQNQSNVLTNSMAINTFNDSYENIANGMGLDTTGLSYSMAKAQETARMNASMQGIMAKKYMPMAKGYLTVIFVAMIPLVIIIALVTSNFKKPFAMIFGLLIALALWNVGDQLLDFIIIVRTKALFALSGFSGYNMESQPFINSVITDTLNLSLSMYWMIPTLAFSVATLSGYGAASMMGGIAGIATSGVSAAASEAAGGNMSMGNIRMSNINMNKYDAAQSMNVGTSTKMGMDHQSSASIQSKALAGTENIYSGVDQIQHKGSTHIYGPNDKHYEVNGMTTVTAGGMQASGMIQQYDKDGNVVKQWEGSISGSGKDMGAFKQNAVNGNEASYQATEIITKNLANNENITTRDSYLAGQQVVDNTDINKRNSYKAGNENIDNNVDDTRDINKSGSETTMGDKFTDDNSITSIKGTTAQYYSDNILINGEDGYSGTITKKGGTAVFEGTKDDQKYTITLDKAKLSSDDSGVSVTGDVKLSKGESGKSTTIDNNTTNINGGTKVSIGDEVNGYTGALAMLENNLSTFGANNKGLMREAFVDGMTKYQNSIMSEQGRNTLSLDKAFAISGGANASVGGKILGTGLQASISAELSASARENSGQISSADLNRVMTSAIMNQLDIDAKNNNWTAKQYDQVAKERFGAYNDYLKKQTEQSFGPSDEDLAPINKMEELGRKVEPVVNKVLK